MPKPRRILILNERDPEHPKAGGAEIHVERIFTRLAERGHRITWHASGFPGAPRAAKRSGIAIERSPSLPAYYLGVHHRLRRARRASEFDLIVECLNKVPFYAPLSAGVPVLALCHHLFGEVAFEQVAWPIAVAVFVAERGIPRAYHDCHWIAISESTRDDLVQRGISPERIQVSHPGIDPPARTPDLERHRPLRISYLGRLEPYKRVDLVLQIAALLAKDHPSLEVYVIGQGSERSRLEQVARELGIEDRTRFTGHVDDDARDQLLMETRVCLFPSPKEGWGLTVIEANAVGTPVVARDAPGLRDSIRPEKTGLLVEDDEPEPFLQAFARAVARLLPEDSFTRAMRREALAWSKHFEWGRAADEMEAAIETCLARGSR